MDFSIVMPIYNSAAYLEKNLARLFDACRGFEYQLILVDDGSDAQDIAKIRPLTAAHRQLVLHEKAQKSNAAVSRNIGVQLATSEIVFFLDADDYFTTSYIMRRLQRHEDQSIDMIFGNYAEVCGDSVRDFAFDFNRGSAGEDFLFLESGDIRSSTISIRKTPGRHWLFPEFLDKHQDWGFLIQATGQGANVAYDVGSGVFLDVGRRGRMTASINLQASERFIEALLPASDRHISGFACKHLLISLYHEDQRAFAFYSSRTVPHTLSYKFKAIKKYGDWLSWLGLFPLGGRVLRSMRNGLRR